jgi:hypothetical protein
MDGEVTDLQAKEGPMGVDQRKRQRKLERKAAKRRAILKERKQAIAQSTRGVSNIFLEAVAKAPIYDCFSAQGLFDTGIGYVGFSRRLQDGRVATSFFLLDVYCLGVKDALFRVAPKSEYEELKNEFTSRTPIVERSPAYVRKLVEGAIEFALVFGLAPHRDYLVAKWIFGDVDPAECREVFAYGVGGKPRFIQGPHDSVARCHQIMSAIEPHGGDFVLIAASDGVPYEITNIDDDEWEFDDADDDSQEEEGPRIPAPKILRFVN